MRVSLERDRVGCLMRLIRRQVAELVAQHGGSEDAIIAAWLHESVEDTTIEEIELQFGAKVASIVQEVTDDPSLAKDAARAQQISLGAQQVTGGRAVQGRGSGLQHAFHRKHTALLVFRGRIAYIGKGRVTLLTACQRLHRLSLSSGKQPLRPRTL